MRHSSGLNTTDVPTSRNTPDVDIVLVY